MDIYEKLARCSTPGEIRRMLKGNSYELISLNDPVPQSPLTLRDIYECVRSNYDAQEPSTVTQIQSEQGREA